MTLTEGNPPSKEDREWEDLAAELSPSKSLSRIDEVTSRTISAVSVVGTLLTGLGLLGATLWPFIDIVRIFSIMAALLAILSILTALSAQIPAITRDVNRRNLVEVENWYRERFQRRAPRARNATYLLLASGVAAAVAASSGLLLSNPTAPSISMSRTVQQGEADKVVSGGEVATATDSAKIVVEATFRGLKIDEIAAVSVSSDEQVLGHVLFSANADGVATHTITIDEAPIDAEVAINAGAGQWRCTSTLNSKSSMREPVSLCQRE